MNYMLFFEGIKKDFDKWVSLGAHDWSYENMKKYLNGNEEAFRNEILCDTEKSSPITIEGVIQYCKYTETSVNM